MWLCTTRGFFSVVCGKYRKGAIDLDTIVVRARRREHLEALLEIWPEDRGTWPPILTKQGTDYPCRIVVQRTTWEILAATLAEEIDYTNFKAAAEAELGDDLYTQFLAKTWSAGWWIMEPETVPPSWPANATRDDDLWLALPE
jgi:hypothetical protein